MPIIGPPPRYKAPRRPGQFRGWKRYPARITPKRPHVGDVSWFPANYQSLGATHWSLRYSEWHPEKWTICYWPRGATTGMRELKSNDLDLLYQAYTVALLTGDFTGWEQN